jgi:hypothetical protein
MDEGFWISGVHDLLICSMPHGSRIGESPIALANNDVCGRRSLHGTNDDVLLEDVGIPECRISTLKQVNPSQASCVEKLPPKVPEVRTVAEASRCNRD